MKHLHDSIPIIVLRTNGLSVAELKSVKNQVDFLSLFVDTALLTNISSCL